MNAATQVIKKVIEINAPREKVWEVLLQDNYNRTWLAEFSAGTYADTDWQLGSKVIFKDSSGDGMIGKVILHEPNEIISVEYEGFVNKGQEEYDSAETQAIKGTHETYRLSEKNGLTELYIESDMSEEYMEMMSSAWDRALQIIKDLAENNASGINI